MISAHPLRRPSSSTAALVRFAAFLVAAVSVVLIPLLLCAAAYGHLHAAQAFGVAAIAAALTLATTFAARSLDPLRH